MEDNYIPYGPEWEKELMKLSKKYLINMVRRAILKSKEPPSTEVENGWVKVEDKMPSINVVPGVLVYSSRGGIDVISVYNDGEYKSIFQEGWNKGEFYEVTHWRPLPAPPHP